MDVVKAKLAMAVVHLIEHAGPAGSLLDLSATATLLSDPDILRYLGDLDATAMLPHPRGGITASEMVDLFVASWSSTDV